MSLSPQPSVSRAMVLAAGLGTRMQPLTDDRPKALVEVMGRALIDHGLDRLAESGVESAVVNVHHFADTLEAHLSRRRTPRIVVSDERGQLLGTGGGIAKALPQLGPSPFLLINSDSLWIDGSTANLCRLPQAFDPARMDALLLLAPRSRAIGYDGRGDFDRGADGAMRRRKDGREAPLIYAGAAILSPTLFAAAPAGVFPLSDLFDRAEADGRLHGLPLEGTFLHVGTPEAVRLAEDAIRRAAR